MEYGKNLHYTFEDLSNDILTNVLRNAYPYNTVAGLEQ